MAAPAPIPPATHPATESRAPATLATHVVHEQAAPMAFAQRLNHHPVVVEVVPPRAGAPKAQVDQALHAVGALLKDTPCDAVNVPEILGSGFQGMDPLDFGLLLHKEFGTPVIVNKVVVHQPIEAYQSWMQRALSSEVASVIHVGGERGGIYYPGPTVLEANSLGRELAEAAGRTDFPIGNVTLPARRREAVRMVEKARSGCDYFVTQIVYEFASANAHLQAYDDVCSFAGLAPRPVLYAFSPADSAQDILFLRYLGVNITPEIERQILATPTGPERPSLAIIQDLWQKLLDAASTRGVAVPLGLVVETVSKHNAEAVSALARGLRQTFAAARLETAAPPARSPGA